MSQESDGFLVNGQPPAGMRLVEFTESDNDYLNPERGFVGNIGDVAGASDDEVEEEAKNFRMVRSYIRLDEFIDQALSQDFVDDLNSGFDLMRRNGLKVVARFTYNNPSLQVVAKARNDASIEQVEAHIDQLGPVLERNKDVIAFFEAGFIGAYGEWHSSDSGLDSAENKIRVRDALLKAVPKSRFVLFRDPRDHASWYGSALQENEAFSQTGKSRSGFHNDCFLTGPTDGNTYPTESTLRDLVSNSARVVPFGGETCALPEPRSACSDILTEGARYSLTYLNWYYYRPAFHERWEEQGCLPAIRKSIGYRFSIRSLVYTQQVEAGTDMTLAMYVHNSGWARLYNERSLTAHLIDESGQSLVALPVTGIDPRKWTAQATCESGDPVCLHIGAISIPSTLPAGQYQLAISLPDIDESLASNPRYSIRFANADVPELNQYWDDARGWLVTGATVLIRP